MRERHSEAEISELREVLAAAVEVRDAHSSIATERALQLRVFTTELRGDEKQVRTPPRVYTARGMCSACVAHEYVTLVATRTRT